MSKQDDTPIGYSPREVADYYGVSVDDIYRRVQSGALPATRWGDRIMVTLQGMRDLIDRSLPKGDIRRDTVDHIDSLVAKDTAEMAAETARQKVKRDWEFGTAAGRRERAAVARAALATQRRNDPRSGTRSIREKIVGVVGMPAHLDPRSAMIGDTQPVEAIKRPAGVHHAVGWVLENQATPVGPDEAELAPAAPAGASEDDMFALNTPEPKSRNDYGAFTKKVEKRSDG